MLPAKLKIPSHTAWKQIDCPAAPNEGGFLAVYTMHLLVAVLDWIGYFSRFVFLHRYSEPLVAVSGDLF